MLYSKKLYDSINDLAGRLQASVNIANNYQISTAKRNEVLDKIRFVDEQVNSAIRAGVNEKNILSTIENSYVLFANKMYDHMRWYMNRTG